MNSSHITNETLQIAVDASFNTQSNVPWGSLDTRDKNDGHWKNESPDRLALARKLLEELPDPPELDAFRSFFGKASAILHELDGHGDNGSTEDFLERINALLEYKCTDAEKAAVEALMKSQDLTAKQVLLQALRHYQMTIQGKPDPTPPVVDGKTPGQVAFEAWANSPPSCVSLQWLDVCVKTSWEAAASAVLAAFGNPSQLRPLSEAGPVPNGCVRVFASMEEKWHLGSEPFMQDSHFADIRLPADEPTPEPLVTKTDSSPTWTPALGDLVQLKSGGPVMTVESIDGCTISVICINSDCDMRGYQVNQHTLTPAKEEQP